MHHDLMYVVMPQTWEGRCNPEVHQGYTEAPSERTQLALEPKQFPLLGGELFDVSCCGDSKMDRQRQR